ncbi:MAG: hypothetical protein LBI80_00005 [Endomicrobium sp.]|nr:hypothetical protein [Endomicrobium sp.]
MILIKKICPSINKYGWKSLSYVNSAHARSFPGNTPLADNPGGGTHGTGMAQHFHEMAPEAEIYLINVMLGDLTAEIINYFVREGILLVSESLNMPLPTMGAFLAGMMYTAQH